MRNGKNGCPKELEQYRRYIKIARTLNSNLEFENIFKMVMREITEFLGVARGSLFVVDDEKNKLWTLTATRNKRIELDLDRGIAGWVARHGRSVLTYDPYNDPRFDKSFDTRGFKTKDILALPIKDKKGKVIGVLELLNKLNGKKYTKRELAFARLVADELAISLTNAILFEEEKKVFESLISVMAATIDARHPVTIGHSQRIAEYSVKIGKELNLPPERLELLEIAALLHDYGKIIIPDYILRKKGALTPEEFEIMKMHPLVTFNILSKIHFPAHLRGVPNIASFHHERINGQGYPYGKKGEEIPLEAKILAVADVFDAITSAREYHEAYPYEKGKEEIVKGSGTRFDPKVVEAFLRFYEKNFEQRSEEETTSKKKARASKRKNKKNI